MKIPFNLSYFIIKHEPVSLDSVGTKALNLLKLRKVFNVPQFIVLSTRAFKEGYKMNSLPLGVEKELRMVFEYFNKIGPIAVRSSATAEDTAAASFAGMYNTTLNVRTVQDGIDAIIKTWRSLDSDRARNYREKMQCDRGEMAIIIQRQLDPEISGVMFTRNPLASDEILIECCSGLGDKLVSGEIEPSRIRYKNKKIVSISGDNILAWAQVKELVNAGERIEKLFGCPQDIEWAIEKGDLYILQARPITRMAGKQKKGKVWCNVNVRETIPDPISPMMYSIFESIMFPLIIIDAFGVPISREQYHKYPGVERVLGRLYWNINNTMALGRTINPIMRLLKVDKNLDPQMAEAFKHVDIETLPPFIPFFRSICFSISAIVRLTTFILRSSIFMRGTVNKVNKVYMETLAMAESYEVTSELHAGIARVQELLERIGAKISRRYFGGLFLSLFYFIFLGIILSLRLGKKGEAIARKTIIGLIDKTGEMVKAVEKLADYARRKDNRSNDVKEVKRLWKENKGFQRLFNDFINEYGHRGPAEFDIASPNWREDYDMVFQLIAIHGRSKAIPDRKDVIRGIIDNARPFERFFIKLLLPRITVFTPLRENGKHYYFKANAKVKDQFLAISEQLVKKNYYDDIRDIFLLELKDLNSIASGRSTPDQIRAIIDKRRQERIEYDMIDAPDIVFEDGSSISFSAEPSSNMIGEPVSFGKVRGTARIIKDFRSSSALKPGEILITHHTDPGWTPLFSVCSGVIVEAGGLICHAAMVARELGLPAVVLRNATSAIPDGALIELDADEGTVTLLAER